MQNGKIKKARKVRGKPFERDEKPRVGKGKNVAHS